MVNQRFNSFVYGQFLHFGNINYMISRRMLRISGAFEADSAILQNWDTA